MTALYVLRGSQTCWIFWINEKTKKNKWAYIFGWKRWFLKLLCIVYFYAVCRFPLYQTLKSMMAKFSSVAIQKFIEKCQKRNEACSSDIPIQFTTYRFNLNDVGVNGISLVIQGKQKQFMLFLLNLNNKA